MIKAFTKEHGELIAQFQYIHEPEYALAWMRRLSSRQPVTFVFTTKELDEHGMLRNVTTNIEEWEGGKRVEQPTNN